MTNLLKRLELQGFKSFAQKTILEFPGRVVGIVGPNGSGKSNVIDAFRWILGEREAKHLRGENLGSLIFAGTPKRPAVGFAKVALYFDNRSRLFPFDTEEVMLVRRVDRSGTSQFFWHDTEVKQKDLIPVLARAKLGSRGLTMIGQGESDIFVRSSNEDRRAMVEEILGLREFRLKKAQAERRLESSEINMEKVRAQLNELVPHLRFLRKQKHRWDKRKEIEQNLFELENNYFSSRYHDLKRLLAALDEPFNNLILERKRTEEEIEVLEKNLKGIESKISTSEEIKILRDKTTSIIEHRSSLEWSLARAEAKMEIKTEEVKIPSLSAHELLLIMGELVEDFNTMLKLESLSDLKIKLEGWLKRLNQVLEKKDIKSDQNLTEEIIKLKGELELLDQEFKGVRLKEEELAVKQQEINQEFRSQIENLEQKKNDLRKFDSEIQNARFEREKLQLRIDEIEREWQTFGRAKEELTNIPVFQGELDVPETERKIMRLRGELAVIGEIDENLIKEANESESRHEFLSRELEDLEKAAHDLKHLIADLGERIHNDFKSAFKYINDAFNEYFRLMFGGGRARMKLVIREVQLVVEETAEGAAGEVKEAKEEKVVLEEKKDPELTAGIDIELNLPKKRITSLDMLSGGEKSLVSLAALFALISVSPPPFLVLDEIDAALDDDNARRFAELIKEFSKKSQFVIVTHNRVTMNVADILYGVTMGDDGVSTVLSLKLEG
ncbi:MAG: AAA family ATPase [Patescibacteria group bacterium]|nr:AAA family ATPase [Patescibacteria group bacterium]